MANQYFIQNEFTHGVFRISDPERHHLFDVMRLKNGDQIEVIFKNGEVARAEIVSADEALLQLVEIITRKTELPVNVTIALGFPKGDKLDFIVEKSTELGAHAIWAAPFDWSVVKWDQPKLLKKAEKLTKVAQNAAQQSMRETIPEIKLFESKKALVDSFDSFDAVLVAYEESAKSGEVSAFAKVLEKMPQKILLIFGPEGGISPKEILSFKEAGAMLVGLGPRILRAETAPLYALSAVSALLELGNKG